VVVSAITTSGPSHVGTNVGVPLSLALVKHMQDEGHRVDFIFQKDIRDAFFKQRIRWFSLTVSP